MTPPTRPKQGQLVAMAWDVGTRSEREAPAMENAPEPRTAGDVWAATQIEAAQPAKRRLDSPYKSPNASDAALGESVSSDDEATVAAILYFAKKRRTDSSAQGRLSPPRG